jgi:transcription antitermination factor NusG
MNTDVQADDALAEWFAVQVCAGREEFSATHLRHRGYEVFLPCYLEHRRWSDRIKKIHKALFTGYVFCRLSRGVTGKVVTTPGVVRVVGGAEGPIPVPDEEIDVIRRVVDTRLMVEPWPFLEAGRRVRVEVGPLRGTDGVVLMLKNRHRLVVSIPMLQRSVAVEIDPAWVSIPGLATA